ncbi:MAG TPA: hypothetical protein VHV83_11305, partial [Armatimonadota bacterium]|nr:hypothetical protein [Armatimonadota bacterium]
VSLHAIHTSRQVSKFDGVGDVFLLLALDLLKRWHRSQSLVDLALIFLDYSGIPIPRVAGV